MIEDGSISAARNDVKRSDELILRRVRLTDHDPLRKIRRLQRARSAVSSPIPVSHDVLAARAFYRRPSAPVYGTRPNAVLPQNDSNGHY